MRTAVQFETPPSPPSAGSPAGSVALRPLPFPYRAMLAICSDLDETPDLAVYQQIVRFLNSTQTTSMGPGVGLEVGNSIYFDMPRGQLSYWNADDAGRAMIRTLVHSGHIDCLHSYGDLATTRAHAARALEELVRHDCRLAVWVDHATAPSNLGEDIMRGEGDLPGSPVYHADLTLGYGIRYVWRGRVTSVIGQDVRRQIRTVFDPSHPAESLPTVAKELAKGALARVGNRKYSMHRTNRVLQPVRLRDGQEVCEFLRSNPHWRGVSRGETADGLAEVLTPRVLNQLTHRGGISILYTHLGKASRRDQPFPHAAREALRRLAEMSRRREILVTTTRRLLGYCDAVGRVRATVTRAGDEDRLELRIDGPIAEEDLQGLTFEVADPARATLWRGGVPIRDVQRNRAAGGEPGTVSIPWMPLNFPEV